VPPGVGRQLAARGFLRPDQPRRHVGNALDILDVVGIMLRVFGVPENVIVLGRPFPFGASAVIVGPDDFVQEAGPAKDAVQQDLAIMHFAVVDVKIQRPVRFEHPPGFDQARLDETQEIVEQVGVRLLADLSPCRSAGLEAHPVAGVRMARLDLRARLNFAGAKIILNIFYNVLKL